MIWMWIGFVAFVLLMLALDLGVFHRKAHVVSVKEAIAWSAVWLALGSAFAVFVYFAYEGQWFGLGAVADPVDGLPNDGSTATEKYLTGYVVEKSLSVDKKSSTSSKLRNGGRNQGAAGWRVATSGKAPGCSMAIWRTAWASDCR